MKQSLFLLVIGLAALASSEDTRIELGPSVFNEDHFTQITRTIRDAGSNQMVQAMAQLQPLIESIQEKCNAAGKPNVGKNLEASLSQAVSCVQRSMNPEQLTQEFNSAARTGNVEQIYIKICSIWPDVHDCFRSIISESKQCLDKEESEDLDKAFGILDDSNNFFCEDNHRRIKDFITQGGVQCVQAVSPDITVCMESVLKDKKPKDKTKLAVDFDSDDCYDFQKIRGCIVKEMARCQSETPKTIIDDYLGLIQKVVCNSASTITWFSTLNVLLMIITYFYSKLF